MDARELRETAKRMGVPDRVNRDGTRLLEIKRNRNDLAHGHKSFLEIGKDTSPDDLIGHVSEAFWYMRGVLGNFCDYLDQKKYLRQLAG